MRVGENVDKASCRADQSDCGSSKSSRYSHNDGDDEETGAPDEEDGEHGEADVLGLLVVAPHVARHVAVGGAEDDQQEVVPLQREEGGDALLADLEVSVPRVHVNQSGRVTKL